MTNPTDSLEKGLQDLILKVNASGRRQILSTIIKTLKDNNASRITAQTTPDGQAFAVRKPQHRRQGSIRQKFKSGAMFKHLKNNLQMKVTADNAILDFQNMGKIPEVHHFGLVDRVRASISVKYTARPLLGISQKDQADLEKITIKHLSL